MDKPMKLHLGCGEKYLAGYINVDFPQSKHPEMKVRADVYTDIRELDYPEDSVDEIRSHHLLEHFSRQEALKLLSRWHRWLKLGGKLVIETPDFEETVREFLVSGLDRQFVLARHLFGSEEADWAYHRDFWTVGKFKYVLGKLGFGNWRIMKVRRAFLGLFGNKLPNLLVVVYKTEPRVDYEQAIKEILEKSLTSPRDPLLDLWLKQIQ